MKKHSANDNQIAHTLGLMWINGKMPIPPPPLQSPQPPTGQTIKVSLEEQISPTLCTCGGYIVVSITRMPPIRNNKSPRFLAP